MINYIWSYGNIHNMWHNNTRRVIRLTIYLQLMERSCALGIAGDYRHAQYTKYQICNIPFV